MKKLTSLILLIALAIPTFCQTTKPQEFKVRIDQNRTPIPFMGEKVLLSKAPFDIVITMNQPMGMLVSATLDKEAFEAAKTLPMNDIPTIQGGGMAEDFFNPRKALTLADDAASYWYYSSAEDHRFDDVAITGDMYTCYRRVEYLDDMIYGLYTSAREADKNVYLIFISYTNDADYNQIEVQRQAITLIFD